MHFRVLEHQLIVAFVWDMHMRPGVDDGYHCLRLGLSLSLKLMAGQQPRDLPVPTSLALGLAL